MSVKGEFGCFAQLHLVCCKLPFNVSGKKLKKPVILVNNPDLSNLTETLILQNGYEIFCMWAFAGNITAMGLFLSPL
jgi:hypothetical protein